MFEIFDYAERQIPPDKIVETWESCFNKGFDISYFKWRFLNNPNEKKVFIKYIMENNTLAAYYAVSPMLLEKKNGTARKAALANMTMTHPGYIGRGYTRLLALKLYAKLKEDGYACVYSYPIREAMCHIFRKYLNFQDVATLRTMYLSKDNFKQNLNSRYSFECNEVNLEIIETAQAFSFSNRNLILSRNKANLKWRLMNNPVNNYYYLKICRDSNVKLILFYKYYEDSIDIIDYCHDISDYSPVLDFSAGMSFLFSLNNPAINGINIWAELDSEEFSFLESLQFISTDSNTFFGVVPLNDDKDFFRKGDWYNSYFDSDVY